MPSIASGLFGEKFNPDGDESKLKVYDFKLAGEDKVGDRDAKMIKYRCGDGKGRPGDVDITLWIDSKSLMPLKRTFVMKSDKVSVTETYYEYKLDPKVDAKAFEPAK